MGESPGANANASHTSPIRRWIAPVPVTGITQNASPVLQQEIITSQQQNVTPAAGERGLGKGLSGMASGFLAIAVVTHDPDEHKNKFGFTKFFDLSSVGSNEGIFSGLGCCGSGGLLSSLGCGAAGATTDAAAGRAVSPAAHLSIFTVAVHCDVDVTQTLTDHFCDPWPGNRGQFSIIYSYGLRPWELIASADNCGALPLILENGEGPVVKLQQMEITGEFPATDAWFGFDGMPASFKSAIVYYKTQNGGIAFSTARQGGTVRLPWNPLAKWT